ncbi:MAG: hypothetical protein AAGF25_04955 [Pseudomonadota bacterium]
MSEQSYPKWIYYYLCFVTGVSVVFAVIIYTNPEAMWGHWQAAGAEGAFSLAGPAGLFCARNLGTAAMGVYALLNKSRPMMECFLIFRIVVDFLDGTHALIGGNTPVIFIGFGTAALQAFIFFKLKQSDSKAPPASSMG